MGKSYATARICLRNLRRSTSDVLPQIPNVSQLSRAYIKHSGRTGQLAHTARAAFDDPPRIGKKMSGFDTVVHEAFANHEGCWTHSITTESDALFVRFQGRK